MLIRAINRLPPLKLLCGDLSKPHQICCQELCCGFVGVTAPIERLHIGLLLFLEWHSNVSQSFSLRYSRFNIVQCVIDHHLKSDPMQFNGTVCKITIIKSRKWTQSKYPFLARCSACLLLQHTHWWLWVIEIIVSVSWVHRAKTETSSIIQF